MRHITHSRANIHLFAMYNMATKRKGSTLHTSAASGSGSGPNYLELSSAELSKPAKELISKYACGVKFGKPSQIFSASAATNAKTKTPPTPKFSFIGLPKQSWDISSWKKTIQAALYNTRDYEAVRSVYLHFIKLKDFEIITEQAERDSVKTRVVKVATKQDTYNPAQIHSMIAADAPLRLPPIIVDKESARDATISWHLVDGNHRLIALKQLKYKGSIPVLVNDYTDGADVQGF